MKNMFKIMTAILVVFAMTSVIFGQESEAVSLSLGKEVASVSLNRDYDIPSELPIGNLQIVDLLADVSIVKIECTANSAQDPFVATFHVEGFDGVREISRLISSVRVNLELSDPKDDVTIRGSLQDEDGEELFNAFHSFRLEKAYDKDGNVSWQVPSWAGNLYFQPVVQRIYLPGVQSASLIDNDGRIIPVSVTPNRINLSGWTLTEVYKYLAIQTSDGQRYLYDGQTGVLVEDQNVSFDNQMSVAGIELVELEDDSLVLQLQPEFGYVPWIETDFGTEGILLDVESYWGVRPISVWIISLDEIRRGQSPEPIQYQRGMILEGSGTVYLYFEFSPWLYEAGGGAKG